MTKRGKKYRDAAPKVDADKYYDYKEAIGLVKETSFAKFNETVDVTIVTGLDVKHADQQIRGALSLPKGIGKEVRVCVFASGEKIAEAEEAGADVVGGEELGKEIQGGRLDFDVVLATPDMMRVVGTLGRVLGPRGMMPNPKTGTVTADIGRAIAEQKAGKVNYRPDKAGVVHAFIGKTSFSADDLTENLEAFYKEIMRVKPSGAKGIYVKKLYLSSTMGPSVRVDLKSLPA